MRIISGKFKGKKLLLPKNNTISENDNEEFYFLRVSDEIVWYKHIFKHILYIIWGGGAALSGVHKTPEGVVI